MKYSNRKQKGKKFEDKIANILQNWLEEWSKIKPNDDQLKVKRSRSSGSSKTDKGDIDFGLYYQIFPELVDIVIECKKWKQFHNPIKQKSLIRRLYNQYISKHKDKKIFLVIAGNRSPIYVVCNMMYINVSEYVTLFDDCGLISLNNFKQMLSCMLNINSNQKTC